MKFSFEESFYFMISSCHPFHACGIVPGVSLKGKGDKRRGMEDGQWHVENILAKERFAFSHTPEISRGCATLSCQASLHAIKTNSVQDLCLCGPQSVRRFHVRHGGCTSPSFSLVTFHTEVVDRWDDGFASKVTTIGATPTNLK